MGDLLGVAVEVAEDARVAAIERRGCGPGDRGPCALRRRDDLVDLRFGPNLIERPGARFTSATPSPDNTWFMEGSL